MLILDHLINNAIVVSCLNTIFYTVHKIEVFLLQILVGVFNLSDTKSGYQFMFRSPKQRLGRLGIIEG